MSFKPIISLAVFFLLISSLTSAQTKKEMRQDYKKFLADQEMLKTLTEKADKGDMNAAYQLGVIYIDGYNRFMPDYDKGIKYLVMAQQAGYPEAMYKFGVMCQYGVPLWKGSNVESPNRAEAKAWYGHAADTGYQPAIDKLKEYEIADNKPVEAADALLATNNYNEAFRILKIAAECNYDAIAMYKISQLYLQGHLVGFDEYSNWLGKAAQQRYGPAILELAFYCEEQAKKLNSKGFADLADEYFISAAGYGYPAAQEKRDAYFKKQDELRAERERNAAISRATPAEKSKPQTVPTETRKTCPVCNGTGKMTDRYTSENRDWENKTITLTDHVTTRACSRCNGKGYYTE